MNKRIVIHFTFWLLYTLENSLFEFTWIRSYFPNSHISSIIYQALLTNISILSPKILFTYLVFYYSIPMALKRNGRNKVLGLTILALIAAVYLHMFLSISIVKISPSFLTGAVPSYWNMLSLNQFFLSMLDLGFIAGIAIAVKLFSMQLAILNREKNLINDKLQTELKYLKNQINPHFLFNTLNNIYALARKKSDLAPVIILKLSKLLRFMLYETERYQIPIAHEIRILEDYIEVEKVRFSSKLDISFNQDIDDDNQQIAPLILLPFVENAFKHGAGEALLDPFIRISVSLDAGNLCFIVLNSKEIVDYESKTVKIGMANVRRQLELMYGKYDLEVEDLRNTFKIKLFIDLNKNATV
jgi:two-component system, LytTR family, sensor kinase